LFKDISGKSVKPADSTGPVEFDTSVLRDYASKLPPDNTIKRIEALEQMVAELKTRKGGVDPNDLANLVDKNAFANLENRVKQLERDNDQNKGKIAHNEEEIESLKRMLQAMSNIGKGGDKIDTNAILMKINMLQEEVRLKADKVDLETLRLEMRKYTDAECAQVEKICIEKLEALRQQIENLRQEVQRNKAEYD
jgi:hypothetical protein